MAAGKKKRADWKQGFVAEQNGRLWALANLAKQKTQTSKNLRWDLIGKGTFNDTLDGLLAAGKIDDLTDGERAYCEGWAALARQQFGTDKSKDDDLRKLIEDAIGVHGFSSGVSG